MPKHLINNILVDFPYEPYGVQKTYMTGVIEALNSKKPAVIESPSGTGKTLSLLCSVLSWVKNRNDDMLNEQIRKNAAARLKLQPWGGIDRSPIRIYYTSKTHRQLAKVMTELKKTCFKDINIIILGSKDLLCIHPQVSKGTSSAIKESLCKMHLKAKSCLFGNNTELCRSDPSLNRVVDIEDLVTKAKNLSCCPYYTARDLQDTADIVFLPYNYIFDEQIRRSLNIKLLNSIIILDDAHNISKVCEESASVTINSSDVALALTEVTQEMQVTRDCNEADLRLIKKHLLKLERGINNLVLQESCGSATHRGSYIFKILKKSGIDANTYKYFTALLRSVSDNLSANESGTGRQVFALKKIADILTLIFSLSSSDKSWADKYFKVYIESMGQANVPILNTWDSINPHTQPNIGKNVHFWCLDSAFGMLKLWQSGIYNMILTSGTLAPLASTIKEFNLLNPVSLELPHIFGGDQVVVNIVSMGPTGVELHSCGHTRNCNHYWNEIGLCLQNYLRIIPDGMLVFFPTYSNLKKAVENWRSNGLWEILSSIKPIFIETSGKIEFDKVITKYNRAISEGMGRGAVLLGVCRGKVVENIDFNNEFGRAVMICGLPYPSPFDPKIKLKRAYLDCTNSTIKFTSGDLWYLLEATRIVNHTIGRIIKHSRDYGAILLCDMMFTQKSVIENLSKWIQQLVSHKSFKASIQNLIRFFNLNNHKDRSKEDSTTNVSNFTFEECCNLPSTSRQGTSRFTPKATPLKYSESSLKSGALGKDPGPRLFSLLDSDKADEDLTGRDNPQQCSFLECFQNSPKMINPAKRRKIIVEHSVSNCYSTGTSEAAIAHDNKKQNDAINLILNLKNSLDEESYLRFSTIIRIFQSDTNFDTMINESMINEFFPINEPSCRKKFLACKKFLTGTHLKRFNDFCKRLNLKE